jgi:RND family efflux transporter MFP subunit
MRFSIPLPAVVRRNKWKFLFGTLGSLALIGIVYAAVKPSVPEYVTAEAKRGSVRQTVEAVGTVTSERDLELQFPTSGVVSEILVKEGDKVRAGQRLAALRAGNRSADVASAQARLLSAQAQLRALQEGNRPEDIAIAEAEVENKRSALESAKASLTTAETAVKSSKTQLETYRSEATIGLSGQVSTARADVSADLTTAGNALSTVVDVFNNIEVEDAMTRYDPGAKNDVINSVNAADTAIRTLLLAPAPADYEAALVLLAKARDAASAASTAVNSGFDAIVRLPTTSYFTDSSREGYKTTLASARATVQSALSSLDASAKALRDASAGFDTRIAAEEASLSASEGALSKAKADIQTYEASLRISQAQLQLKRAPPRQTDLDSAIASVRQAQAEVARAAAEYANTVINAPVDGTITKVAVKAGELAPAGSAVTMLGNSPFRVEMYVSEIDIPKILLTQTGAIELDAFRGTRFALRTSDIDSAATDKDGVPKYRVKLDFVYPHSELKIGMTGDAEILIGIKEDVLNVPLRAVLENEEGKSYVRVLKEDGEIEEREVTLGLEGEDGGVEVTGVEEGEIVVVLVKE